MNCKFDCNVKRSQASIITPSKCACLIGWVLLIHFFFGAPHMYALAGDRI